MFQFPASPTGIPGSTLLGQLPRTYRSQHARHLMTPRHPPRALMDLTTPTRPRPDPEGSIGAAIIRAMSPISSGAVRRVSRRSGPRSNDPRAGWFESRADPSGSTFVDESRCHYHTACVTNGRIVKDRAGAADAAPIPATGQGAGQHPGGPATPRARWGAEDETSGAGSSDPAPGHPGIRSIACEGSRVVRTRGGSRRAVPAVRAGRCRLADLGSR